MIDCHIWFKQMGDLCNEATHWRRTFLCSEWQRPDRWFPPWSQIVQFIWHIKYTIRQLFPTDHKGGLCVHSPKPFFWRQSIVSYNHPDPRGNTIRCRHWFLTNKSALVRWEKHTSRRRDTYIFAANNALPGSQIFTEAHVSTALSLFYHFDYHAFHYFIKIGMFFFARTVSLSGRDELFSWLVHVCSFFFWEVHIRSFCWPAWTIFKHQNTILNKFSCVNS